MTEIPNGKALKAIRLEFGLSQARCAEAVGVNRTAWTKWEADNRPMSLTAWILFQLLTGMMKLKRLR